MKSSLFLSLIFALFSKVVFAQTVFIDDLPNGPHQPAPSRGEISFSTSENSDAYLPSHLKASLKGLWNVPVKSCDDPESYNYVLSLTVKGQYLNCVSYVNGCLRRKHTDIPVPTLIQGARCAKSLHQFSKTFEILDAARKSEDFTGEHASALVLEFALFAQFSIYTDRTNGIIASHPFWTADEKDTVKSLVEFLGKTMPVKKSKEQIFQFVNQQISGSQGFYARLLKTYRISLNYGEHRYQQAYDYLIQDAVTLVNPLDWWSSGFQILYSIAENADFTKPIAFYNSFRPYANLRSWMPVEANVYNYTQIYSTVCKSNMLQGKAFAALKTDVDKWKRGEIDLKTLLAKLKRQGVESSNKADLLSTYAGLLVIDGQKALAREYYWKSHQACAFNNRSHWGLNLLERKDRYAAFPEFAANVKKLEDTVSRLPFPQEAETYFLNWKSLPEVSRNRVKFGSRIWAPYIKDMNANGYKVYIKLPFELLSLAPGLEEIRDKRIGPPDMPNYKYDNRLWDDVRGLGGETVVADHDETFETVQGDYNLLGHEMAHQFHSYLRGKYPVLAECIENLYRDAVKKDTFPDRYAATNSSEYFAQGITYFLIPADAPARYGINSSWYPKNDPHLDSFMKSIQMANGVTENIQCPL